MKILAISDQVEERFYHLIPNGHFREVGLVVSCGDLPYEYLEYIVSMMPVDLYYVPGNHDPAFDAQNPAGRAQGCVNMDLRSVRVRGLLLAGFGGSIRYRPDAPNQYTQADAFMRALALLPRLMANRLRFGRALDLLVTHSPPEGIHDDNSSAHRGLRAINWLLRWARPRYHLHGHMHDLRRNLSPDVSPVGPTTVINVFPYRVIDVAPPA